jgi:hypothetical protein
VGGLLHFFESMRKIAEIPQNEFETAFYGENQKIKIECLRKN